MQLNNGEAIFRGIMRRDAIAMKMREFGVAVDHVNRKKHHRSLLSRRRYALKQLAEVAEHHGFASFNPNGWQDCHKLFYDILGAPKKYDQLQEKVVLDGKHLVKLITHEDPAIAYTAKALLRYRKWQKLDSTYVKSLPIHSDGLLHPEWDVTGAKTLRFACRNPNLMNIVRPVSRTSKNGNKIEVIPNIRNIIKPLNDAWWFVEADYSAIELRLITIRSEEAGLVKIFQRGDDVHKANASVAIRKPVDEITKGQRSLAKTVVYAKLYLANDITVQENSAVQMVLQGLEPIPLAHIQLFSKKFFEARHKIAEYQHQCLVDANNQGYIEIPQNGYQIYFYKNAEAGKPINYRTQGEAAAIMNSAFEKVAKEINWMDEIIAFQIHDAIILQGKDPYKLARILEKHMPTEIIQNGLTMPIPVEFKIGKRYGEGTEFKTIDEIRKWWQTECKKDRSLAFSKKSSHTSGKRKA